MVLSKSTGKALSVDLRTKALNSLSSIVQNQLNRALEVDPVHCNGHTLLCGHHSCKLAEIVVSLKFIV